MRGRGRNLRGKGAGATKVIREGENINRQGRSRGTNSPSIGSLLSRGVTKQQLSKLEVDAAKCTDAPNFLPVNTSFFQNKLEDIEFLLNDLKNVGAGTLNNQHLEVEVRLLTETDPGNLGRFTRVLDWLQSFEDFATLEPLTFEEKTYVVPASNFKEGYTTNLVRRNRNLDRASSNLNDTESYLKVKKLYNNRLFLPLPSAQICPRLGISLEAPNFKFDTTGQDESKTFRQRWKFPIDSNTATRLGINFGQNVIAAADSINYNTDRIGGLPEIKTDVARGSIDLTITELPNHTNLYSIEIELDPDSITALATERQVAIFGGREVTTTSRDVKYLTLSDAQLQLLDTWTKILISVITKTGVFMTSPERQAIEDGFNRALGIPVNRSIPAEIVNQPTDLHKRDLSWLSPEKSEMFMHLANYDQLDEVNLSFLEKQGLFKPLFSVTGGYYASLKADGTRYYLYFASTGLYLINPLSNTLTQISGLKTASPLVRNILPGTILDTEVIGDIQPTGTLEEYQILVFDILALENLDVRNRTYTERLQLIETVIAKLNDVQLISQIARNNEAEDSKTAAAENRAYAKPVGIKSFQELIKIQAKPVYKLPSLDDIPMINPENNQSVTAIDKILYSRELSRRFFKTIGTVARASYYSSANLDEIEIFDEASNSIKLTRPVPQNTRGIKWYTDGIILTPAARPYLEIDTKKNLRFSMVKKWKPIMTIDFRVRRDASGRLTLMSGANKAQGEVPFTGGRYPWYGQAELTDDMEGKIIEFQWSSNDGKFTALRERPDKLFPNNLKTAIDVWTLINDPITIDDLEGKTMMLMGRYHNRVKTYALADLAAGINLGVKTLLDLGSGRGGDINKWQNFKRVYAVEPDIENLREFISRQQQREPFNYMSIPSSVKSESPESILNSIEQSVNQESSDDARQNQAHYNRMRGLHARSRLITPQNLSSNATNPSNQPKVQAGSISTDILASATKRVLKVTSRETQASTYSRNQEMEDRQNRIVTINLTAEDTTALLAKVPIDKVNAVTMFNALTFFYRDLDSLLSLINTVKTFLKVGGYFYVLAMDGELLLNFMGEHNTITTQNIEISKSPDVSCRKIWIKSKVGIVRGQYEYLIHLREFVQIMTENGFKLLDERYLDEELLLTDEEYWFSSMFKLLKFAYGTRAAADSKNNFSEKQLTQSKSVITTENKTTRRGELLEILRPLIMENANVIPPLEPYEAPQLIRSTFLTSRGVTRLLRYGNPQDASAYLHAILRAFSKPYNALNLAEKQGFIIQLRKDLADKYTEEIHRRLIPNESPIPALRFENFKAAIGDATSPITQHMMEFINDQLQVNVLVLRGIDAIPYQFNNVKLNRNPAWKTVILYWINDDHFETVGQLEPNNFVRLVFDQNHAALRA